MKIFIFFTFCFLRTSADTHCLEYHYIALTPRHAGSEFTAVGLLDEKQFMFYSSSHRRLIPENWIKNSLGKLFWKNEEQIMKEYQDSFSITFKTIMDLSNHTRAHILQRIYGCKIDDDGTTSGYNQYGYIGEDFIILDLKTPTWIAVKPQAEILKHNWESTGYTKYWKNFLENKCIDLLNRFVNYGRKTVERKVPPTVSVFQKHSSPPEVVCHATGFYPKALNISWQKDGEDVHEDVDLRETLPNQDGSFQKRSILKVSAEELQKHTYTCVIEHSSLEKDLVLPVNERRILRVCPETSLFQVEASSPEVVCDAKGFFPKALNISWQKDGQNVLKDVVLRETLPYQDGSFQKRSILKVSAEELQKHTYTCVIEHSSLEKDLVLPVSERRILRGGGSDGGSDRGSGRRQIAGVVAVIVVFIAVVALIVAEIVRKQGNPDSRDESDDTYFRQLLFCCCEKYMRTRR